jgi:hypothetical protein
MGRGRARAPAPAVAPGAAARHPPSPDPHGLLALQRSAGNQAVRTAIALQRVGPDGKITDPAELARSRPVGGDVDMETHVRVIEALLGAPRSRAILDAISALRGDLFFRVRWSARSGYHQSGEIWLDRNLDETHWLKSMAHEITHLHTFLAGREANIRTMGRAEFVAAKMTDEVEAHAASYVSLLQLGARTSPAKGFAEFQRHLARRLPNAVRDGRWADVETLAKAWIEERYRTDPAWRTGNTGENYYDYWGAAWDRAHAGTP